jgi:CRISPR-associated protein Csd1
MLNTLVEYAEKHLDSEPGFTTRMVRWLVEIAPEGKLVNVLPIGGDRGEQTPRCPEMHNMNAGGRAHFLVESLQTIALLFKADEDEKKIAGSKEKRVFYTGILRQAASVAPMLHSLELFLGDPEQVELLRVRLSAEKAKPSDWLRWSIADANPLEDPVVLEWWRNWRQDDLGKGKTEEKPKRRKKGDEDHKAPAAVGMVCFLSGEVTPPLSTQPKITGLSGVGGLGTGDVMVGFDKAAFCSFGLEQASNAAMGERSVRKYVDALNHLVKNDSRKLANALVVHWYKETIPKEDDPLEFLSEPPEATEGAALQSAREVLESMRKGLRPVIPNNRYYAMTVSGAAGRVMVRDWMEGSFEELVVKIEKWFSDLDIVARDGQQTAREPKFMAVCGAMVRDLKDLPAPTAARLWRVALGGLPIPQPFIAQAMARFRADLIEDKPFNHARMGLIKAYFIRKGEKMEKHLNREHPEPAYQCGRLLAVLASLQRAALGDVGAGVVQRYYVAASQTPGLTLGRLFHNAKNHLNKLEGGLAFWYEGQIAEIMSQIQDRIPSTLNLDQQSLFALGYYQQIAANRAGKTSKADEAAKGDNE